MKSRNNQPIISACLVVFNEDGVIEECMQSLQSVVKDIIVVHDGPCRDNTLTIAKKYGAKVFERPHHGMCEAHRVFSFEQASGDWILVIDADERLTDELIASIPELVSNEEVGGYRFIWPHWDGKKQITKTWPYKELLFRRESLRYLGFAHEPLKSNQPIRNIPLTVNHRPNYNNFTWNTFRRKWLRWARIQAKDSLKPFSAHPKFGMDEITDWPLKQRLAIRYSYFFPLFFLITLFYNIRSGPLREGLHGLKTSIMNASYFSAVYMYISAYRIRQLRKKSALH